MNISWVSSPCYKYVRETKGNKIVYFFIYLFKEDQNKHWNTTYQNKHHIQTQADPPEATKHQNQHIVNLILVRPSQNNKTGCQQSACCWNWTSVEFSSLIMLSDDMIWYLARPSLSCFHTVKNTRSIKNTAFQILECTFYWYWRVPFIGIGV